MIEDIKVTHIGLDYAKVEIKFKNEGTYEYEINCEVAQAIKKLKADIRQLKKEKAAATL